MNKIISQKNRMYFEADLLAYQANGCWKIIEQSEETFGFVAKLVFIGSFDAAGFPIPN
jgi:hypothetical protein